MNQCGKWRTSAILLAVTALCGCGSPDARFVRYNTFAHLEEGKAGYATGFTGQQREDVDNTLAAMFGTPSEPLLPVLEGVEISKVLDLGKLKLAAGRVGSDASGRPRGLYREHCAHCHGVTGDGNGPTASFLNPYPRDYRPGIFKFKSTPIGHRPIHDDLKKIVIDGIPGTAMPSFRLLSDQEIEALVHYVKYLAIRGEAERQFYHELGQLDEKERLLDPTPTKEKDALAKQKERYDALKGLVGDVVQKWLDAPTLLTTDAAKIPSRVSAMAALKDQLKAGGADEKKLTEAYVLQQSRERGRKLFYGAVANCFTCHGPSALGDGQLTDYDAWTIEYITKTPTKPLIDEYVNLGMPKPRNIRPRNLRQGVYRGGLRPLDLYWRVRNGIEGTPMPGNDKLKPEEIWHLVNYVQSLPYEPISDAYQAEPENMRERN